MVKQKQIFKQNHLVIGLVYTDKKKKKENQFSAPAIVYSRGWQTFSANGQIVYIVGFADHKVYVTTTSSAVVA